MEQYSLTYDFGSGSLKAALVNAQHRIAASCNLAYSTKMCIRDSFFIASSSASSKLARVFSPIPRAMPGSCAPTM